MDEKKVLFLCNSNSFMVNAIANNLEKEGFVTSAMRPKVNDLSKIETLPPIIIAYLDSEEDNAFLESLVYLRDRLLEHDEDFLLYLIGTEEEIERFDVVFEKGKARAGTFLRPINVKELVETLLDDIENDKQKAQKKRILVVDDDPTMLNTIHSWLEDRYQVYLANSGLNAIALLTRHNVDLILLDYEMPVVSGAKVLEMIRNEATTQDIPVMFLTAKGDREHVMNVIELKPVKYLLKSMSPEELNANIDEFFVLQKGKEL